MEKGTTGLEIEARSGGEVLGMPRHWYIPTDLYEAHRPSAEITRLYLIIHDREGLA